MGMIVIDPQTADDIVKTQTQAWMEAMRRSNSIELGFAPMQAYLDQINRGKALIVAQEVTRGGHSIEAIGFLIYTATQTKGVKIMQLVMHEDERRRGGATEVVAALAARHHGSIVSLKCREDLTANHFWSEAGFQLTGMIEDNNAKGIKVCRWEEESGFISSTLRRRTVTQDIISAQQLTLPLAFKDTLTEQGRSLQRLLRVRASALRLSESGEMRKGDELNLE